MSEQEMVKESVDPRVDQEVRELLVTARIGLLLKTPFIGNLATRLKLVNADTWCNTAATDGRNFYYNTDFVKSLTSGEREFLFGHEVLHCVYDHFGRRNDRNPKLWNIANDYCVNADLKKYNVGQFITTVDCLYDEKYADWSSEQVYDDLMENAESIDVDSLIEQMLDEHLDSTNISEEERQQIRDEIKEAVLAASQSCDPGTLPKGVKRLVQGLTEPKMDWRELLRVTFQSTVRDDYTWNRASRKSWHMDAIMPGNNYENEVDITVALDLSGSISELQIRDFLSEIRGIVEAFSAVNLHIFSFDTEVYNYQHYTPDNIETIEEYECIGGGGTAFGCIFDFLKEQDITPDQLVIFTDGFVTDWGDPNYCDTIFILHNNALTSEVPYGIGIEYSN